MRFVEENAIQVLFFNNADYPKRLRLCDDAPILLYYKGNANLNASKTIAVIGTRRNTDYGLRATEYLIDGLRGMDDLIVISGLASGIDTIAHKSAMKNGLDTVGVLGHGLDMVYPPSNKNLASEMIEHGGILTEFSSKTNLERGNFPVRNRIVAGMSDITVVTESDIKGGAIITAYIALSYNRDLAAFPGRVFDTRSQGPNDLIRRNMAAIITGPDDLLELMNWNTVKNEKGVQQQMFVELSDEEKMIVDILRDKDKVHADEIFLQTRFKASQLASTLLQLEMQGIVKSLPGKFYRLN
jgi:DNA processing protein